MGRRRVLGSALAGLLSLSFSLTGPAAQDPDEPTPSIARLPRVAPVDTELLLPVEQGSAPTRKGLRERIEQEWTSPFLGPASTRSLVIRDVSTGATLLDLRGDRPLVPASTAKILSAAAIMTVLDPELTLPTTVVAGRRPGEIVLVAGGDLLLASGRGDPEEVAGRAGITDLAERTARALEGRGSGAGDPVRVLLDTTYAEGPDRSPGWTDGFLSGGFTGRIGMLGLQEDRALPTRPGPRDPPLAAAEAFREALTRAGVRVLDRPVVRTTSLDDGSQTEDSQVLATVRSAPVRDVLALALATSDNATIESLARQGALRDGIPPDEESVTGWVLDTLVQDYEVDVTGARLADTSGLSPGSVLPMRLVADVLVAGGDGSHPSWQEVQRELPIAGWSGTLFDRFLLEGAAQGRGVVRAKTGSLPGVTALAGTLVTTDGTLLAFALTATDVGEGGATLEARAALDDLLADVVTCGC